MFTSHFVNNSLHKEMMKPKALRIIVVGCLIWVSSGYSCQHLSWVLGALFSEYSEECLLFGGLQEIQGVCSPIPPTNCTQSKWQWGLHDVWGGGGHATQ